MQYRLPDQYEFISIVGEGGGGTVIKAYDRELRKDVVLKKIHSNVSEEERRVEVDVLKNLNHQYLPAVYGYKTLDGEDFTVMDYVSGKSFADILESGYVFSEKETVKFAKQLCEALCYLHSRMPAVIHGDIKPANIMLRDNGEICLIDFNISGISKDGRAYTTGYSKGYGAPEQKLAFDRILQRLSETPSQSGNLEKTEVLGAGWSEDNKTTPASDESVNKIPIDESSDIYSLGATLFHMCSGVRIDCFDRNKDTLQVSEGFLHILNKALSDNPEKRYRSAAEMLKALQNIQKADKRYKGMQVRHFLLHALFFVTGVAGIIMAEQGYVSSIREGDALYEKYVSSLAVCESEQEFSAILDKATELRPDRLEAYLQQEIRLFSAGEYDECIDYTKQVILGNSLFLGQSDISTVYYLLGNCYFETGAYDDAITAFEESLKADSSNSSVYANLAIAYARSGRIDSAKAILEKADDLNIDTAQIEFVNGEISLAQKDYETAILCFKNVISKTTDDYRKMRAYVLIDEAYMATGVDLSTIDSRIDNLNRAKNDLPLEDRFLILNRLVQAYIDASESKPGQGFEEQAIESSVEIISLGYGNVNTYSNIIILKQRIGDLDGALEYAKYMEEKYPDSYVTMKRRAILEIEIQAAKKENERNYSGFAEYYSRAQDLLSKQKNNSDAEMLLLEQTYKQLVEGNWLQ